MTVERDVLRHDGVLCLYESGGRPVLNLVNSRLAHPYPYNPHSHHELEISCIREGEGLYRVDDRAYDLRPGDVILLNNTESHSIVLAPGQTLWNMVVHFEADFIWNALGNGMDYEFLRIFLDRGPGFSNRLDRDNPATARIFQWLLDIETEMTRRDTCYDLMVRIKLQSIFAEILRHYDRVVAPSAPPPVLRRDLRCMDEVLAYIADHLDQDLANSLLAQVAHVSASYFPTFFKRYIGLTPTEYVSRKRVEQALARIRSSGDSLLDIALSCGFNNATNFYKTFRRVTGHAPSHFRDAGNRS